MKRTPLFDEHVRLDARLAPFAGWEMPLHYGSQVAEHFAVRKHVGAFDVSHMGQFFVKGSGSTELLQRYMTNDVAALEAWQACYGPICNDEGGIIDDLIVSRLGNESYLIVVNAARIDEDYARLIELRERHGYSRAETRNASDKYGMVAVQGPQAERALGLLFEEPFESLQYMRLMPMDFQGVDGFISRTGYTGEDGFEVILPNRAAAPLWERLMEMEVEAGIPVRPCGLGARDTLRLEAGYLLSGQDIGPDTNPLEAGLRWCAKLETEPPPAGAESLKRIREEGPKRKLVGLVLQERGIPRHDSDIVLMGESEDRKIGHVTSGSFSPTLNQGIALGYVDSAAYTKGASLGVDIRGKVIAADVVRPPFVKNTSLKKG